IAPHAVFTVELKSWGGRVTGNRDRWVLADGVVVQSPIPLIQAKARTLKGRLQHRRHDLASVWVQGLVFLSASDAAPQITPDYADLVVTLADLRDALTDPNWLGNPQRLTPGQRTTVEQLLADGKPPRASNQLGEFRLVQRL